MIKNFCKVLQSKTALATLLPVLMMFAAVQTAHAQSAEIRAAGVYYIDGTINSPDINDVYCNWGAEEIKAAGDAAYKGGIANVANHQTDDPWDTSALIEYDQPYPSPTQANKYPNHCLALCFDVYCTNKPNGATTYSISFPLQTITFGIAKYYNSKGIDNEETNPSVRVIHQSILDNRILDADNLVAVTRAYEIAYQNYAQASESLSNAQTACANIGHGVYYKTSESGACLTLSASSACPENYNPFYLYYTTNTCASQCQDHLGTYSTYADAYANYKIAKASLDSASSTLSAASQDLSKYMCAGYSCLGAASTYSNTCTCPNPEYVCDGTGATAQCTSLTNPTGSTSSASTVCVRGWDNASGNAECSNGSETKCLVKATGAGKGYNEPIRFCTSWDGAYEIAGEFGKTNGQFGFRANVKTNYPGDGIAVETIEIDDTFIYPSDNQYPIQVDVTNVHTVRTTPTVVGSVTAVQATPYTIAYRLSKDSDVKIQIYDASAAIPVTNAAGSDTDGNITGVNGTITEGQLNTITTSTVRNLVDWKPRLGEGMKGTEKDALLTESDSWDGRDDSGRLLPANNYLISVQAKSQDEWPGTDFSRAVTRQLSLDPLKLTDISTKSLSKQSTAYATVRYVPTESANVYFEVYSPGTVFESQYTRGYEPAGSRPVIKNNSGVLVYSNHQHRARGMSYPEKWDGLCHNADGCTITYPKGTKHPLTGEELTVNTPIAFANGSPLPDGDYVYALWAEIPYTTPYFNGAACYTATQSGAHYAAGCAGTITTTGSNGGYTTNVKVTDGTGSWNCAENGKEKTTLSFVQKAVCTGAYTGVKTLQYYTGLLSVERGVVDITIQPVSYSTIGSSPTAYGLDPFIFKYSIAREAVVHAYVQNTAGVLVKTLTTGEGEHNTNVAQQMNTLTWDGRDDQGRLVGPGTYMFVVETSDPMFPNAIKTQASAIFPVDLYRITDVTTTDVYGDSEAKATISYQLSKAMNVQINVYNKDVVIPSGASAATQTTASLSYASSEVVALLEADLNLSITSSDPLPYVETITTSSLPAGYTIGSQYKYTDPVDVGNGRTVYYRVQVAISGTSGAYDVSVQEVIQYTIDTLAAHWPPRVCDQTTDADLFTSHGYVNPADKPQCIYVNDTTFTNYPANPLAATYNYTEGASQTLDVRLQPIKTFNRSALKAGDGITMTEEWDAQYFYNPTPVSIAAGGKNTPEAVAKCTNATDLKKCPYEMVPDGTYPFYVAAKTEEPMDVYYDPATAAPLRSAADIVPQTGLYSTDKPTYRINITRGPVYFLDGSVAVYPNAPQLFNTSSGPVFVPPYEINFAISRAATVEVAVVALQNNMCTTTRAEGSSYSNLAYDNNAGDVCKYLSTMTIPNTANFDPNIVRRIYWDGTDNNGKYVKNGNYEIRLTAKNYPDEGLYQPTVKQYTLNVDLLKVFDLPDSEAYAINVRGTDMKVSYQISVPMKVAIQIFKPGTTIFDYTKGTLRDPSTGKEVTDIRDVLVKSIVGIRPSTTLIEEVWDGTDYAQQGVPDGTYPFRFVTALNSADIDSITGEIIPGDDAPNSANYKINYVADANEYVNLHHATVAIGDGQFVCEDWEKTVFFYPNPFKTATGTLEVTKMPVPGKMSIKIYNLAGDLVREGGYTCVDAQNMVKTMGGTLEFSPDNNISNTVYNPTDASAGRRSLRNAALRCFWDRTNDHGKKVARGVYFGLVDFRAQNGRQHCQKVVKILIPR